MNEVMDVPVPRDDPDCDAPDRRRRSDSYWIVRTTALSRFLSARPCAHAWNDARNDLYRNGVDDLFFGPWNPTCTA